jgi:hypothetical protein
LNTNTRGRQGELGCLTATVIDSNIRNANEGQIVHAAHVEGSGDAEKVNYLARFIVVVEGITEEHSSAVSIGVHRKKDLAIRRSDDATRGSRHRFRLRYRAAVRLTVRV